MSYNNSPSNFFGGRPSNQSPYGACQWHRGFSSTATRRWSDNPNSLDSPASSRSPSIFKDEQPRKRLHYHNVSQQSKRSKPTLGRGYRASLKQMVPRSLTVTNNAVVSCSTPKKDPIVVTDGKSPEPLPESLFFSFKESEQSQPLDFESWSKEKITQIREL